MTSAKKKVPRAMWMELAKPVLEAIANGTLIGEALRELGVDGGVFRSRVQHLAELRRALTRAKERGRRARLRARGLEYERRRDAQRAAARARRARANRPTSSGTAPKAHE